MKTSMTASTKIMSVIVSDGDSIIIAEYISGLLVIVVVTAVVVVYVIKRGI